MKALNAFDASILAVLADAAPDEEVVERLYSKLETDEAREIGRVIMAPDPDSAEATDAAKSTARALLRTASG